MQIRRGGDNSEAYNSSRISRRAMDILIGETVIIALRSYVQISCLELSTTYGMIEGTHDEVT
jgi:hypothetical protein